MKKLIGFFLWTCTAAFLGLLCILGMSAAKGHFSMRTLTQIVALLNGIDIQGQRLTNAIKEGRSAPVLSYEDVLEAKNQAMLDRDFSHSSLVRYRAQLNDKARILEEEKKRHDANVAAFKTQQNDSIKTKELETIQKLKAILEALDPAMAKEQLSNWIQNGKKADVVSMIDSLDADKLKKILAEFSDKADQAMISEILNEIRGQGKVEGRNVSDQPPAPRKENVQ